MLKKRGEERSSIIATSFHISLLLVILDALEYPHVGQFAVLVMGKTSQPFDRRTVIHTIMLYFLMKIPK